MKFAIFLLEILTLCNTHVYVCAVRPSFSTIPPPSVRSMEGEPLHLRCTANGKPSPVITWEKDGKLLRSGEDGVRLSGGELAMTSLAKRHGGKYTCKAQNAQGQVEHTTVVLIQGPPTIIKPPHNATIKEGQEAMFTCRAEAFPTDILYTWTYNGEAVDMAMSLRGRYSVSPTGTLVIFNVNANDKGNVVCKADNGFGSPPTAHAELTVRYPARVTNMPSFVYAGLGLKTVLHCPSIAEPPTTTVTWHKNGQAIAVIESGRFKVAENGDLQINEVRLLDAGKYTCTPFNSLGTMGESTGSSLIIRDPPYFTVVPDARYEVMVGKSIDVPCKGSGDPPPHVYWEKVGEEYNEPVLTDSIGGRVSWAGGNLTINSATKSDNGHWKCVLSNAVAEVASEILMVVKFTSPHGVGNVTVETGVDSATITWKPGFNGGYDQHFTVWFKEANKGDDMWERTSVNGQTTTANVRNLIPDTIYQFSILPENILGSGQFSKTISAQTKQMPTQKPTTPPIEIPSPPDFSYEIDGANGLLVLTWNAPDVAIVDEDLKLLGYVIEYRMRVESDSGPQKQNNTTAASKKERSRRSTAMLTKIFKRTTRSLPVDQIGFDSDFREREENGEGDITKWSKWKTLMALWPNETRYVPQSEEIYRNQLYQFQLLAVSSSSYSKPSDTITIDTTGLVAYGLISPPGLFSSGKSSPAVVAGVVTGIVFIICVVLLTITWFHRNASHREVIAYASSSVVSDPDGKAFQSPTKGEKEVDGLTIITRKSGKRCSFRKFKKKVLKAEVKSEPIYKKQQPEDEVDNNETSNLDPNYVPIRRISRASDGKFHVSEDSRSEECHSLMPSTCRESECLNPPSMGTINQLASPSAYEVNVPLLRDNPVTGDASTLEIDCSQSSIAVRFVKDDATPPKRTTPQLYNLSRRITEPYLRSPTREHGLYPTTTDYQLAFAPYSRPMSSNYVTLSPYAQYVHLSDVNNRQQNARQMQDRRISSPPTMSTYNPTPASPSKSQYHKHTDQPGGHYHVSPSYVDSQRQTAPGTNSPGTSIYARPNRHSAVVFRDGYPIYQTPPQRQTYKLLKPPMKQSKDVPKSPLKGSCSTTEASKYNTLPNPINYRKMARSVSCSNTPTTNRNFRRSTDGYPSLEKSLSFHRANKSSQKVYGNGTSSLGRASKHKSMNHKRVKSLSLLENENDDTVFHEARQRVRSVDDISLCHEDISSNVPIDINANTTINNTNHKDTTKNSSTDPDTASSISKTDVQSSILPSTKSSTDTPERHPSEAASSGYDSQNTSHTSGSPISLSCQQTSNQSSYLSHDRFSTASSIDRNRKDTSSVDDKYEWDSELVMESEILEALRHYGSQKRTMPVSKAILTEIQKLGSTEENFDSPDSPGMYSKASMDRRCAALKQEYMQYKKDTEATEAVTSL